MYNSRRYRFSAPLRNAVRSSPLTQTTMGAASDLSQTQVSLFVNGRTFSAVTMPKIERLAELVGIAAERAIVEARREAR